MTDSTKREFSFLALSDLGANIDVMSFNPSTHEGQLFGVKGSLIFNLTDESESIENDDMVAFEWFKNGSGWIQTVILSMMR